MHFYDALYICTILMHFMHSQMNFMHFSDALYSHNIVQPEKDALLTAEKYATFSKTSVSYRYIQQKQNFTLEYI